MAGLNQMLGTITLGVSSADTDVSEFIVSGTFTRDYNLIERPGTFATGRVTQAPGTFSEQLDFDYLDDNGTAANSFTKLVRSVVMSATPTNTLYYTFKAEPGASGSANEQLSGTCVIPSWVLGGEVGTLRRRSMTLPVLTSASTPVIA